MGKTCCWRGLACHSRRGWALPLHPLQPTSQTRVAGDPSSRRWLSGVGEPATQLRPLDPWDNQASRPPSCGRDLAPLPSFLVALPSLSDVFSPPPPPTPPTQIDNSSDSRTAAQADVQLGNMILVVPNASPSPTPPPRSFLCLREKLSLRSSAPPPSWLRISHPLLQLSSLLLDLGWGQGWWH